MAAATTSDDIIGVEDFTSLKAIRDDSVRKSLQDVIAKQRQHFFILLRANERLVAKREVFQGSVARRPRFKSVPIDGLLKQYASDDLVTQAEAARSKLVADTNIVYNQTDQALVDNAILQTNDAITAFTEGLAATLLKYISDLAERARQGDRISGTHLATPVAMTPGADGFSDQPHEWVQRLVKVIFEHPTLTVTDYFKAVAIATVELCNKERQAQALQQAVKDMRAKTSDGPTAAGGSSTDDAAMDTAAVTAAAAAVTVDDVARMLKDHTAMIKALLDSERAATTVQPATGKPPAAGSAAAPKSRRTSDDKPAPAAASKPPVQKQQQKQQQKQKQKQQHPKSSKKPPQQPANVDHHPDHRDRDDQRAVAHWQPDLPVHHLPDAPAAAMLPLPDFGRGSIPPLPPGAPTATTNWWPPGPWSEPSWNLQSLGRDPSRDRHSPMDAAAYYRQRPMEPIGANYVDAHSTRPGGWSSGGQHYPPAYAPAHHYSVPSAGRPW